MMNLNQVCCLLLSLVFTASLLAAEEKSASQYSLSESSHKILTQAQEHMDKNENDKAQALLENLATKIQDKKYDLAVTLQTLGYVYYAMGEMKLANKSFKDSIAIGALPKQVQHEIHYIIAQLSLYLEDYKQALEYLNKWFADETDPNAEAHLLAANAYYQTDQYQKMIPHMHEAIDKTKNAPANWYELLLSAYIQTKKYKSAASLLEDMIKIYPDKKDYWLQLAAIYQQDKQDKKALAITELAYLKGYLSSDEILSLAKNYLYFEMPYEAAELMEKEIQSGSIPDSKDNLGLLANAWLLAQEYEKAIITLKRLSDANGDSKINFQLAQLYFDQEKWQEAKLYLEKTLGVKNFDKLPEAYLLMGITSYELDDKPRAMKMFNKALAFENTKEQAKWWLHQIKDESETELEDS